MVSVHPLDRILATRRSMFSDAQEISVELQTLISRLPLYTYFVWIIIQRLLVLICFRNDTKEDVFVHQVSNLFVYFDLTCWTWNIYNFLH